MKNISPSLTKVSILLYFSFLFPLILFSQAKGLDCKHVRTGTFYFYPHESKQQYVIIRDSVLQKEINLKTNDTSLLKINWQSACIFKTKFINTTRPQSELEKSFFNSHVFVIEILFVKNDYYIFKQGLDSLNSKPMVDTLWFKPK